jgi:hypothetical protein
MRASIAGSNAVAPERMTSGERLYEIAAGLLRLRALKSSALSADPGESSLPYSPDQRGHAVPRERKVRA